nr:lipoprotein insertase outer membrane protein LolB [Neiella litorisoli]
MAVKNWIGLLLVIWLSGCVSLPPDSQHADLTAELLQAYQAHSEQLGQFDSWRASGKLAFISPEQRQSSRVNWQHSTAETHILLTNTLGVTLLEASQNADGASMTVDGEHYQGQSLADLIAQLSGYRAPFDAMNRWLTGYADLKTINDVSLDSNGYLLGFSQYLPNWGVWHVEYNGYYPATDEQPALPSRITLKHPNLTLKLAISRWQSQ